MLKYLTSTISVLALVACSAVAENENVPETAVSTDAEPTQASASPADTEAADETEEEAKWQPQDGDVIAYKVLRKGKDFGSHSVTFSTDGDTLTAKTNVKLKAGLGPITVFSYTLNATETWKDGHLVKLSGEVDDDGTEGSVTAEASGETLTVNGTVFQGEAPAGILPASHWNFGQTQASKLLSTEDGEILDVAVTEKGRETITVGGADIEATRYLMDSDIDVDLWYDDEGRWVKLAFEARGQQIEYVLSELY